MTPMSTIRNQFRTKLEHEDFRNDTVEIRDAQFIVSRPTLFGDRNDKYIEAEIEWYESQSLQVEDLFHIYGKPVAIWQNAADEFGLINSNYGWCIYSEENGEQYQNVLWTLFDNPTSRQAVMIYINPDMHKQSKAFGMADFMCTTHVVYTLTGRYLHASVHMRSNDAIFGFTNDNAWQQHVLYKLADDLSSHANRIYPGLITWNATSLHVYPRHYYLIKRESHDRNTTRRV